MYSFSLKIGKSINFNGYNLILQSTFLKCAYVMIMTSPINEYSFTGKLDLKYNSLSYTPRIKDKDVKILTHVFHPTLTELWFVDFDIVNRSFSQI